MDYLAKDCDDDFGVGVMLGELNCNIHLMVDKTILNGFPKADVGTAIFFQEEKATYIYNGDGEWQPLMISNDYEEYKEEEIAW